MTVVLRRGIQRSAYIHRGRYCLHVDIRATRLERARSNVTPSPSPRFAHSYVCIISWNTIATSTKETIHSLANRLLQLAVVKLARMITINDSYKQLHIIVLSRCDICDNYFINEFEYISHLAFSISHLFKYNLPILSNREYGIIVKSTSWNTSIYYLLAK